MAALTYCAFASAGYRILYEVDSAAEAITVLHVARVA
jgi:mRNA-degrading endonuclease RelE of RelBE toxin-antitoxin system